MAAYTTIGFPMSFLAKRWQHILQNIVAPTSPSAWQLLKLMLPFGRSAPIRRHAASVIMARVQLLSLLFAVLVPLFAIVDLIVFALPQALALTAFRLLAGLAFLALSWPREASIRRPYAQAVAMLLAMLLIPTLFFLASLWIAHGVVLDDSQRFLIQLYGLMPTLVLAGLAIFPLSALEILLYSLPVLVIASLGIVPPGESLALVNHGATYWFMCMMIGVAMFSGMSQSHYMESLVHRASTDPLTQALTRRSGIEALERALLLADAGQRPLTVLFLDLDRFKAINDQFGHDAGDQALITFAAHVRKALRDGDMLIRWGGEEFVVVLPGMPVPQMPMFLQRLRNEGLGRRVDGQPLVASVGVAEMSVDNLRDWPALVSLADQRLYEAKNLGRARAVLPDGQVISMAMS